ncbi:GGDEF domain-containing protein [Massilia sp. NR 4-1]|uniref:GGDEF domain-containing protein n=1 Tax=Massilia sp. NR 4-1 TaxID=1678028 RepID=UPI00067CB3CE|nr:GGDEF domain-containing protein [Massilia sp. NR 4-1]
MSHAHRTGGAGVQQLLRLAQQLLTATNVRSALDLTGASLACLNSDEALILLRQSGTTQSLRFDAAGQPLPSDLASALYRLALHALTQTHGTPTRVGQLPPESAGQGTVLHTLHGCTLLLPFPPAVCEGVFLLNWHTQQDTAHLAYARRQLQEIACLAGACLAGLNTRQRRETRLNTRVAVLRQAGRQHAQDMRTRDAQTAEARDLASTDVMTGLQNRRGFFARAEQCFLQARQQALACAVVFADVDGLKTVNDELGHEKGDELIRHGAAVFRSTFQSGDVIARLGGDEFAAFTFDEAAPEDIRARLSGRIADFNRSSRFPSTLSLSAGVVSCDTFSSASLADYLQLADVEMYQQKHRHVRSAR